MKKEKLSPQRTMIKEVVSKGYARSRRHRKSGGCRVIEFRRMRAPRSALGHDDDAHTLTHLHAVTHHSIEGRHLAAHVKVERKVVVTTNFGCRCRPDDGKTKWRRAGGKSSGWLTAAASPVRNPGEWHLSVCDEINTWLVTC